MYNTHINLRDAEENFRVVKDYAQMSINFCKKYVNTFWSNYTDCIKYIPHTNRQIQEIDNLRMLIEPRMMILFNLGTREACSILLEALAKFFSGYKIIKTQITIPGRLTV